MVNVKALWWSLGKILRLTGGVRSRPESTLADLARKGLVTPAANPRGPLPPRKPVMPLRQLLEELDRDREDR
jgi:hypothetical protein